MKDQVNKMSKVLDVKSHDECKDKSQIDLEVTIRLHAWVALD